MSTPLFSIIASRHHRLQEYWIAQNDVASEMDSSDTMNKGLGVAPKVVAGVTAGLICVAATVVVILVMCWRYPLCRTRTFWDHGVKRIIRKIYSYFSGIRQQKQEEKLRLVAGVFTRKASRQETRFVVPQIFIHRHSLCYGSQQVVPYTFELEDYRRGSTSSVSSRKSSLSSRKSSMSGRDSIISFDGRLFWPDSRRGSSSSRKSSDGNLSLLPDDRRGSGSSRSSRKSSDGGLSLINDYDRRGSNSSRKSSDGGLIPFFSDYDRRGSNSSRSSRKSSDAGHSNLSFEGESDYSTEAYDFDDSFRFYGRRVRFRRDSPVDFMAGAVSAAMMAGFQIRRSNSLAEMRRLNLVAATPQDTSTGKPRPRMDRRATLSSLVVSSLQALDQTVNPVTPSSYLKKKVKVARRGSIGLPFDTPLLMHDLNLEEMRMPRTMSPVQPVGTLEIHLQFNDAKTSISVTVIKANNLSAVAAPPEELFNPYVKVFLIPGRSSKYKTKIINKTKNPVFEENFRITDLPSGDFNDESGLEFQVYSHESVTRKPLLGVCSMRLAEIEHLEDGYAELTLLPQTYHKCHQGDLRISGCYQPVAGKMVFNILEAKNLPKVSLMGTINPYVKVEMYLNGIREAKQKTKTKQNVQDPLWHHQCLFEVNRENPKLLGHTFLFSVMHRDRMRGTQLIGQVELGWYSHGEQLDHWCEIMEHPHRPTDNWHPVIKTCKSPS